MEIEVEPSELLVEMLSMPAIVANCLMSGIATEDAMVSGEAPGRDAETLTTGKSARGKAATGRSDQAKKPPISTATDMRIVATGLVMQNCETFMGLSSVRTLPPHRWFRARCP